MKSNPVASPYREISFLYLLQVIQRRWLILLFVGLVVGGANALLFALTPYTFESTITLLVSRTRSREDSGGVDRTVVDCEAFASALDSPDILDRILQEFRLNEPPYNFDIEDFRKRVAIWAVRSQNSVIVRVRLNDLVEDTPKLVSDVANAFSQEADRIANELLEEDIRRSMALFNQEYERAEKDLEKVRESYREKKLNARIEEMKKLIESLGNAQSQMLIALSQAQSDFVEKSAKQADLDRALTGEKPILDMVRSLEEEPSVLNIYAARTGKATTDLYNATSTRQEINPVFVSLRNLRDAVASDVAGVSEAIHKLPEYVEDYSRQIREAEKILNASEEEVTYWQDRLKTAHMGFGEVSTRREVAVMAIASDRQDLLTWIRAFPPLKPIGLPRFVLAVASALVAMILLTVLILLWEVLRATTRPEARV